MEFIYERDEIDEIEEKIVRSMTQRIHLLKRNDDLKFTVVGTTPHSEYELKMRSLTSSDQMTCTCPDFNRRKILCKHCYFVLIRVLKWNLRDVARGEIR